MAAPRALVPILITALTALLLAPVAEADRAKRTRPSDPAPKVSGTSGERSAPAPRAGRATPRAVRPGGAATVRAGGRATYGYYHGRRGGGYYGGRYYGWPYPYYWYHDYYWPYRYLPYGWWIGGYYGYGYPIEYESVEVIGPATLETDIRPKKAVLWLDGEEVGRAKDYNGRWDRLAVEPGRHTLRVEYPGYRAMEITWNARAGQRYRIDQELRQGEGEPMKIVLGAEEPAREARQPTRARMRPAPPAEPAGSEATLRRGRLRFDVTPADAAVYLDGDFLANGSELARLHGAIPVAVGEHEIEVVRPGFEGKKMTIVVEEGKTRVVEVRLSRG